jgi:small GTP-binding protein
MGNTPKPEHKCPYVTTRSSYKIVLVGDLNVGKTNLSSRFETNQNMIHERSHKIGLDSCSRELHGKKIQLWVVHDLRGNEQILKSYIHRADGVMIIYDITNMETFNSVQKWLTYTREDHSTTTMLIGNKIDLMDKRQVSTEQGTAFAKQNNLLFTEMSALDYTLIEEVIETLTHRIDTATPMEDTHHSHEPLSVK